MLFFHPLGGLVFSSIKGLNNLEMKTLVYPFTALVGQNRLKRALLFNVINPRIGGVLINGQKGTAKSTAVRSFSHLVEKQ